LRPRVTVLSFGEGEECGIALAGVVERPGRGWIHVGEIAGAKVKNGEVVPFDVDLPAVSEKGATFVFRSVESEHLTGREERDPDVRSGQSEFLGQPV
jgi:hypothetical protein